MNQYDTQDMDKALPKASTRLNWIHIRDSLYYGFLLILIIAMAVQMWSSILRLSVTSDEIDHIHAGYRYLQCGDFGWNPEHPPLAKEFDALPLLFMHVNDPITGACGMANDREIDFRLGHDFLFGNPESVLARARYAASLFALLLLVTTWFFARKMFGVQVATIASLLVAFEPNLVGHGALVATDVPATFGVLLVLYALYAYVLNRSFAQLALLGVAMGIALALKHSALVLLFIVPPLLLGDAVLASRPNWIRGVGRAVAALAVVGAISLTLLWASYGFRYVSRPSGAAVWTNSRVREAHGRLATTVIPALQRSKLLPAAYLSGLQDILIESENGRAAFLFGNLYWGGRASYFPAAALVKLTLPTLILFFVSFAAIPFWRTHPRECAFLLWPTATVLLLSMTSGLNIGFRHIFPAIPLVLIFAAAGSWYIAQWNRWVTICLVALLFWHVVSSVVAYPNYISYANELFGGPGNAYKYLSESNVDWGQAQKMARDYVLAKRPERCVFIHMYNNFDADYGIPCIGVSELEHEVPAANFTGTVIVSSNALNGVAPYLGGVRAGQPFRDRTPVAKLGGGALLVYEGTFDLTPIATEERLERVKTIWVRDHQEGLAEIRDIVASDPASAGAHIFLCDAEWLTGQFAEAEHECNAGLDLFEALPGHDPGTAKTREDIMRANGMRIYHAHQPIQQ